MTVSPQLRLDPTRRERRKRQLDRARSRYQYLPRAGNQLAPIASAKKWPWWGEQYGPSWGLPFLPGYLKAYGNQYVKQLRVGLQRAAFRFDKLRAYRQLFIGRNLPDFVAEGESDAAFAYRRIAGPNPIALQQERDLGRLCGKIPLDLGRVSARLEKELHRPISLESEAANGRLFVVDYTILQTALAEHRTRDSRWREKYLCAPIGVFLEAPGFYEHTDLVPLAIRIDQPQPGAEQNPVYYPDDDWGWRIAKTYFEAADINYHSSVGHVLRTHLLLEPFCLSTPRQLPEDHPVFILLRPHTRYTLPANQAAYKYFIKRSESYCQLYSGTLEDSRNIAKQDFLQRSFREQRLLSDLESRGVQQAPADYPYRDDALLWLEPIHDFAKAYVEAFYPDDAAVKADAELQDWAEELMDPAGGNLREMVSDERLDSVEKLVDLLAQVLFIAGPGHASQHYSGGYYYRYAPASPSAAFAPPPWDDGLIDRAFWVKMLPPIAIARMQFTYNTFVAYKYDRFGFYSRYRLGRLPQAQDPIRKLQLALAEVERTILKRAEKRGLPYEFLLPSQVPNAATI